MNSAFQREICEHSENVREEGVAERLSLRCKEMVKFLSSTHHHVVECFSSDVKKLSLRARDNFFSLPGESKLLNEQKHKNRRTLFMLRYVLRVTLATALIFGVSTLAVAQYGGMPGMPGMPGTPTYTPHTYSSKGPIIAGVMGAAAGGGLLYWKLHNRATLQGCVGGDGDKLVSDKDDRTYTLVNNQEALKPGERVELKGKKTKDDAGEPAFEVHKMSKDLGSCTTTAETR